MTDNNSYHPLLSDLPDRVASSYLSHYFHQVEFWITRNFAKV